MKRFCVNYEITTIHDTIVKAKTAAEAAAKVAEVIGSPVIIGEVREYKDEKED